MYVRTYIHTYIALVYLALHYIALRYITYMHAHIFVRVLNGILYIVAQLVEICRP